MRKTLTIIFLIIISSGIWAQNCELYLPLVENTGMQYQNFNRRDRLEGTQDVMIKQVTKLADRVEALVNVKYYDNRENFQHEGEYTIACKGNELLIDIQSMLDPNMMAGFENMEVSISGTNIEIPGNMKVGDVLPEATMDMKVTTSGMTISEMKFITRNRKVEAKESITTPAGTFECFKITYENFTETRAMGIPVRVTMKGVEYYAPGIGNVRSEFYDDRDRLQSYTILSKLYNKK
jgi:hypothetical protein